MENKVLMSAVKKQGRTVTQHKSSKSYEFILLTRWETQRINEVRWRFRWSQCFEEVDQGISFIMSCQFDEIFRTNQALAPFFSSLKFFLQNNKRNAISICWNNDYNIFENNFTTKKKETIEASWVRLRSMHFYLKSLKRHT